MRAKVSGPESLESALVVKMEERKNDNWLFLHSGSGVYSYLIIFMDVWGLDR